jgi:CRISPR-associated protein Csd1
MILQELVRYYDRLAETGGGVARRGFFMQGVAFCVVLDEGGRLVDIHDIRVVEGKTPRPKVMELPGTAKPSGSGLNPSVYGWDRTDYMLGYVDPESFNPDEVSKKLKRCREAHDTYRQAMLRREHEVADPEFSAFLRFLESWDPRQAENFPILKDVSGMFGAVRVGRESQQYLHDNPKVHQGCDAEADTEDRDARSRCLVTNQTDTIARIHPIKIKGVAGAQSSGATLVGFNDSAYESFGFRQSFNAQVGEEAAFKYTTALNKLLERGSRHLVRVSDTTVVFWADQPTPSEDLFGFGLDDKQAEDAGRVEEIAALFNRIRRGEATVPDSGTGFHVLGLAPNAARLSVRFWVSGTAGEMCERVIEHQRRLEIARGGKDREHLPLWLLLAQTARETKDIPPVLGGSLLRSIVTGSRYPLPLLQAVIRRIHADREIRHPRAALIKAILIRNFSKEIPVSLNPDHPAASYQLGRLFAALEHVQQSALPGLNATIKDRYFGAASSTPASVFSRLIRMSQHHIGKLDGGRKVWAEKQIQEICSRLAAFPSHLGLEEQGHFALGYYHQRSDYFTKKTD